MGFLFCMIHSTYMSGRIFLIQKHWIKDLKFKKGKIIELNVRIKN